VVHWIYPTVLRRNWAAWDKVVWTLSLVALIGAITGVALGIMKSQVSRAGLGSPFRGWHAWHHILGLFTATFVVTWIFSGWLSMDHGLLFSRGRLSDTEAAAIARTPDWSSLAGNTRRIPASAKEVEWFAVGERLYKRERTSLASQSLSPIGSGPGDSQRSQPYLTAAEVDGFVRRIAPDCAASFVVGAGDNYPAPPDIRCSRLSVDLRRRLVSDRRRHRRSSRTARCVTPRLSLGLHRPAYAGFSDIVRPSGAAQWPDRVVMRHRVCILGDGSGDRLA
jgi:hypothetical protein